MISLSKVALALIFAASFAGGALATIAMSHNTPTTTTCTPEDTSFDKQFREGKVERAGSKSY